MTERERPFVWAERALVGVALVCVGVVLALWWATGVVGSGSMLITTPVLRAKVSTLQSGIAFAGFVGVVAAVGVVAFSRLGDRLTPSGEGDDV